MPLTVMPYDRVTDQYIIMGRVIGRAKFNAIAVRTRCPLSAAAVSSTVIVTTTVIYTVVTTHRCRGSLLRSKNTSPSTPAPSPRRHSTVASTGRSRRCCDNVRCNRRPPTRPPHYQGPWSLYRHYTSQPCRHRLPPLHCHPLHTA